MRLFFLLLFCLLIPALSFNIPTLSFNMKKTKLRLAAVYVPKILFLNGIKNNLKHSDYIKYGKEYLSDSNEKFKSVNSILKNGNIKEIRLTERGDDHLKAIIRTKHKQHDLTCTRAGCDIHTKHF